MKTAWQVEVRRAEKGDGEGYEMLLAFTNPDHDESFYLIRNCFSLTQFENRVERLRGELEQAVVTARREVEAFLQQAAGGGGETPEEIWRRMEQCEPVEAMIDLFNRLPEGTRAAVAEYVFTRVSMFKGMGPVFAQRYDATTHQLV